MTEHTDVPTREPSRTGRRAAARPWRFPSSDEVAARVGPVLRRLCAGRRWRLVAAVLVSAMTILLAFPSLQSIDRDLWEPVLRTADHPFEYLGYDPASHESKVLYRVTVPLVGRVLGLDVPGYLALQFVGGVALLYLLLTALHRATSDRITSLVLTAASGSTYAGAASFVEIRGIFDGIALMLVVAAMARLRPVAVFCCLFLAAWTDERAVLASGFVVAYALLRGHVAARHANRDEEALPAETAADRPRDVRWVVVAACAAVGAYVLTRAGVAVARDLPQPAGSVGPEVLLDQLSNLPVGIWTGLEGLWLLVAGGVVLAWKNGARAAALVTAGTIAAVVVVAGSVFDITRSMAYLLPAVAVGAAAFADAYPVRSLRRVAGWCLLPTLIWPVYYVGGSTKISWLYPLPIQVVRWLTGT